MPRLRTVSTRDPGWRRVHHGRGYRYLDADGSPLGKAEVERIKALVIPPAWRDVWISPYPNGAHPGRRHRRRRAPAVPLPPGLARQARRGEVRPGPRGRPRRLPEARERGARDLGREGMPLERGVRRRRPAARPRLLPDRQRHLRRRKRLLRADHAARGGTSAHRTTLLFAFAGKSGVEHAIAIDDPAVCDGARTGCARRSGASGCSRTRSGGAGATSTRPTSTTTSASCRRRRDRQGLPHLARHRPRRDPHSAESVSTAPRTAAWQAPGPRRAGNAPSARRSSAPPSSWGNTPTAAARVREPAGDRPRRVRRDRPGPREAPGRGRRPSPLRPRGDRAADGLTAAQRCRTLSTSSR